MITFEVDRDKELTIFKASGEITPNDLLKATEQFYSSTEMTAHMIWDFSEADFSKADVQSIDSVAIFARTFSDKRSGKKTALVSTRPLAFGLAKMYQAKSGMVGNTVNIQVFKTMEDAIFWIEGD